MSQVSYFALNPRYYFIIIMVQSHHKVKVKFNYSVQLTLFFIAFYFKIISEFHFSLKSDKMIP